MDHYNLKIFLKEYLWVPTKWCWKVLTLTKSYLAYTDVAALQHINVLLSFRSAYNFIFSWIMFSQQMSYVLLYHLPQWYWRCNYRTDCQIHLATAFWGLRFLQNLCSSQRKDVNLSTQHLHFVRIYRTNLWVTIEKPGQNIPYFHLLFFRKRLVRQFSQCHFYTFDTATWLRSHIKVTLYKTLLTQTILISTISNIFRIISLQTVHSCMRQTSGIDPTFFHRHNHIRS